MQSQSSFEVLLVVGVPLLLAAVEVAHPQPQDLLALDTRAWLFVHYAQLALFPLCALACVALLRGYGGMGAAVSRLAMLVFAISFTAFDTAAGIVTGILVEAARASATPDAWRAAIDAVWSHPVLGGSPSGSAPVLAVVGSMAWSVGTVAAAVALKRGGRSWPPVLLLAISGAGLSVFRTHAWPGGPLTFGGFAIAAAWLWWERTHPKPK